MTQQNRTQKEKLSHPKDITLTIDEVSMNHLIAVIRAVALTLKKQPRNADDVDKAFICFALANQLERNRRRSRPITQASTARVIKKLRSGLAYLERVDPNNQLGLIP